MQKLWLALSFAAMVVLAACGGDSSSKADGPEELSVDTYDDLPNCTENREGMEATTEDGETYICVDGEWTEASGPVTTYETFEDMPNCTAKREGETAYVKEDKNTYVCTDGEWSTDQPESSGSSSSKPNGKKDDGDGNGEGGDDEGGEGGDDEGGNTASSGESSSGTAPSSAFVPPVIITDGKTVEGSCYPDRAMALKNDTVTWYFVRAVLDTSVKAADIVAYHALINGTDCAWTLTGATKTSTVVKCSKTSVKAVYGSTGKYTASIKAGENTITCNSVSVVNEYPSSSSEETSSSSWERLSSSEEPESSSEEESSSSEKSSSSVTLSSSGGEESSGSVNPGSSGSEEESSGSVNPESSGGEEPSSSVSPASSDASIYNATANTLTDLRDGQVYRTTTIDIPSRSYSEVWMAKNLNYETGNSWCGGGSDTTEGDCSVYGRLYTWATSVGKTEDECGYGHECGLPSGDVRGVCPKGWHLPSRTEWEALFTAVGGFSTAGQKLKSLTGWNSGNGTDAFGFSALPAGDRYRGGSFNDGGNGALFWSSTEYGSYGAYYMYLVCSSDYGDLYDYYKDFGYSVRCLKD